MDVELVRKSRTESNAGAKKKAPDLIDVGGARRLVLAIMDQAIRDIRHAKDPEACSALTWFERDAPAWCETLGISILEARLGEFIRFEKALRVHRNRLAKQVTKFREEARHVKDSD